MKITSTARIILKFDLPRKQKKTYSTQ